MKYLYSLLLCLLLGCCSRQKNNDIQDKKHQNSFYDYAFDLRERKKPDSAFLYFNKAKDLFLQQKNNPGVGKCLINMAIIATDKGDYFGGQEILLEALQYFDKNNKAHATYLESNYNELGITAFHLKYYSHALNFYQHSLNYAKNQDSRLVTENNIANIYRDQKDYKNALKIYTELLKQKGIEHNSYARILTNIAIAKWLENPNYNAESELKEGLKIREMENDLWGLNSSYNHLSHYFTEKRPKMALFYAYKMYKVAQKINSPDDQLEALQKLIKLSPQKEARQYFEIYQNLSDSVQTARNAAKNQFALIRYETEKSKADNLVLQKDNEEKKYQLLLLITGTVLLSTGSIIWYTKRKQRLKLEAENAIRESQLKTSKKVHDKVANKIYRVMSEVENKDDLDRNHLLDQLEHIYNTSRDISYEITDSQQSRTFSQQLSAMFSAYISNTRSVEVINNEDELWANVPENTKAEIFIILLELMTNVKKHSQATSVKIRFRKSQNIISINYHDNGIGLPKNVIYNNGLKNTETRIKNISGTITFESTNKSGLEILISFAEN